MNLTLRRRPTTEPDNPASAPATPTTTATTTQVAADGTTRRRRGRATAAGSGPTAVNLLSPWVLDQLRVHRLRRRFVGGTLALVVATGLATVGLHLDLATARNDRAGDEAVATSLDHQVAQLAPVEQYVGAVGARGRTISTAMAAQVDLAGVLGDLRHTLPRGATLTALTVSLPDTPVSTKPGPAAGASPSGTSTAAAGSEAAPAAPAGDTSGTATTTCAGADPFGVHPVVGCIQISGTARDRADVAAFVLALDHDRRFVEPFVTTTTVSTTTTSGVPSGPAGTAPSSGSPGSSGSTPSSRGGSSVTFTGTVGLTQVSYTHHFAHLATAGTSTPGTSTPGTPGPGSPTSGPSTGAGR